jgi:phospholipid/cholesterol/gamma-HCH transport system substrate-binding protein
MFIFYMRVPTVFLGIGRYTVTVQLPEAGGLYGGGNVTYRGFEVGKIGSVHLTEQGAEAELILNSDTKIPADLIAEVHSVSAVGEQYVQLLPQSGGGPTLSDGDVIPQDRATVPPDINALVGATNRGLNAIPGDNLKTVVDESYLAFGGLGPDLSRLVTGSTKLAKDARRTLDAQITLIEKSKPILDSQTNTSDSIQAWAANLADVTSQLKSSDPGLRGILEKGPAAAGEVKGLLDRVNPTLPVVLANLASVNQVAIDYRPNLEALLVLLPAGTAAFQGQAVTNRHNPSPYAGGFLAFNLNVNLPPPCTTGYLPAQQRRSPALEDYPDRPDGLFCRTPQDSTFNVRGAKNYPCETKPGKRAPTVKLCESGEDYVPLNEGWDWKGDPNETLSGQPVPMPPPGEAPATSPSVEPPPIAFAEYDPATGTYVGPDGKTYTKTDLASGGNQEKTWQSMLIPPTG